MISINAIDHINLTVTDLGRSIEFYRRVFGLEVREDQRQNERPYAIVGQAGVGYVALHERQGSGESGRGPINHWGFVVDDFDALRRQLDALGVDVLYRTEVGDGTFVYPRSLSLYVADPDGNEIELTSRFGGGLG